MTTTSRPLRALVVEDEAIIAMLMEEMLSELGHTAVATAGRLEQATVAADSLDFDVAIVDVNLAGQASYPVAEILTRRSIPFVFVSGYGSSGLRPEWQHVASVSKPVDTRQLGEAIARAMADPAPKP